MKPNLNLHLLAGLSLFSLSLPADASAAPRLPALFGDHMAIQADRPTPCWGWSQPGAGIDIVFKDDTSSRTIDTHASADASGRWQTTLPALPSGSRGTLRFTDPSGQTIVRDVIAAEVWLASGQSNMTRQIGTPDFPAQVAQTARTEAAGTGGGIRFFSVPQEGADEPTDDVHGKWIVVTPESVAKCSAVAWNFALSLHDELKSPVGMIVSAYGGTPVESWLPREALDSTPEAASQVAQSACLATQTSPALSGTFVPTGIIFKAELLDTLVLVRLHGRDHLDVALSALLVTVLDHRLCHLL